MTEQAVTALSVGDFQERVAERIRASIGDLMPDDVLRAMVERALEQSLFEEKVTVVPPRDRWGAAETKREPPFLPGYVAGLVKERLDVAIREHMDSRREEIDAIVNDVLGKGVALALVRSVEHLFQGPLQQLQGAMMQSLDNLRQGR